MVVLWKHVNSGAAVGKHVFAPDFCTLSLGFKTWFNTRHYKLSPPIGFNLIAIIEQYL